MTKRDTLFEDEPEATIMMLEAKDQREAERELEKHPEAHRAFFVEQLPLEIDLDLDKDVNLFQVPGAISLISFNDHDEIIDDFGED